MELSKFLVSISQFLVRLVSFFFPRYISNHLHGLFAGAWDPQTKDPLPVDIPLPNQSQGIDDVKIMNRTCLQIFETKLSLQELWGGQQFLAALSWQLTLTFGFWCGQQDLDFAQKLNIKKVWCTAAFIYRFFRAFRVAIPFLRAQP